jgi:hypothetical protein
MFLELARSYPYRKELDAREQFEAFLEAAIIFSRVAIHRLHEDALRKAKSDPSLKAEVDAWWDSLRKDPAIEFIRKERDFIAKTGPPKWHQNVTFGETHMMEELYYLETPDIPATETIERHLRSVEKIVTDAEERIGTSTLLGQWRE